MFTSCYLDDFMFPIWGNGCFDFYYARKLRFRKFLADLLSSVMRLNYCVKVRAFYAITVSSSETEPS